MKLGSLLGITVIFVIMIVMEWPRLRHLRRERTAFAVLTAIGYLLALLLLYYPEVPGPTQMFEMFYKPFTSILE
ncbi:hypothetical protein [Paenibacillus sp. CF384]|uniref:hypothetical protein n=1 Tax=Paenibacillus sp. CF384 TaxID=1884382 RepID=UPI000895BDDE|nr:hypothetical protein [Paenibacillus sp. CF384]SDW19438.1 hypothetical protein SAMN05518855_1001605 [Paenibacillus sp. CF384]